MAYYIKEGLPYYTDGVKSFPCSVAADSITVKFDTGTPIDLSTVKCLLTEGEVKHALGVRMVTDWDDAQQKTFKKTNKTVSSIPVEPEPEYNYTVNFYKKDTTTKLTASIESKAKAGQVTWENPTIEGYKLVADPAQPTSMEVTSNVGSNVANVYYEIDSSKQYNYTVHYYIDSTENPVPGIEPNPKTGQGNVEQVISIEHPSAEGYTVKADQPTSLTLKANNENTAIVYYETAAAKSSSARKSNSK